MTDERTTRVVQRVRAPRADVYRALLDRDAIANWKVPAGMTCVVHEHEPREGGRVRVSLTYDAPGAAGKTRARTDTYAGRFERLVADREVVEVDAFETDDPALRGEMRSTFTLHDAPNRCTDVRAAHERVPPGVSMLDNDLGWRTALARLAAIFGPRVRPEAPGDAEAIFALEASAFETDAEARIVDALRAAGALTASLVAEERDGALVGHVAFSPVTITSAAGVVFEGAGLGPMAVAPRLQRTGVGAQLVAAGLSSLRAADVAFCVVLGHADYYPRVGFERASARGVRWEHDAPDECFFVRAIRPDGLDGVSGVARYRPELGR